MTVALWMIYSDPRWRKAQKPKAAEARCIEREERYSSIAITTKSTLSCGQLFCAEQIGHRHQALFANHQYLLTQCESMRGCIKGSPTIQTFKSSSEKTAVGPTPNIHRIEIEKLRIPGGLNVG